MFAHFLRPLAWATAGMSVVATVFAVSTSTNPVSAKAMPNAPAPANAKAEENPAVEPGLVKWHKSFDDAKAAASKSGKPVLLFHMMGQLDKQFC